MDYKVAKRSVRLAAVAAFAYAALLSFKYAYGLYSGQIDTRLGWGDPLNLIDTVVGIVCGIALFRYSRLAAIVLCCSSVLVIGFAVVQGQWFAIGAGVVFVCCSVIGLYGAISYHKLRRKEDPSIGRPSKWWYVAGVPTGLVFSALLVFGLIMEMGWLPSASVVRGLDMSGEDKYWLVENGIVGRDESVRLFYTIGLFDIESEGNILTNKRVISYESIEGEMYIYHATFDQISRLEIVHQGGFFSDTIIEISTFDGLWFQLYLSAQNGGDARFIEAIESRMPSYPPAPRDELRQTAQSRLSLAPV